jgi:hypothetical protein
MRFEVTLKAAWIERHKDSRPHSQRLLAEGERVIVENAGHACGSRRLIYLDSVKLEEVYDLPAAQSTTKAWWAIAAISSGEAVMARAKRLEMGGGWKQALRDHIIRCIRPSEEYSDVMEVLHSSY